MIELTEEQQQTLAREPNEAPRVVNPRTNEHYVLVSETLYEKFREILAAGGLTEEERRAILQGVWRRAGWDDPAMDDYEALLDRTDR
jgi:hypothetical protein